MPVSAVRVLRAVAGEEQSDAELLRRFADRRDEGAFALLVRRHGPMVFGVCRRMLPEPDAEDAFQAVFLVLARKARTAAPREVANWLYGVARRAALVSRRTIARRRERTGEVPDRPAPEPSPLSALRAALDEELSRLPEIYRAVVVLCHLEGRTQREAAGVIGCPEGTVAGRLSRAREMLARRLARHAPAVSVAAVLSGTAAARVPTVLPPSATIPPAVAALTRDVLGVMVRGKLMRTASVLFLFACAGVGMALQPGQDRPAPATDTPAAPAAAPAAPVKSEVVAWGPEVDGLQAGVAGPGPVRVGETARFVVKLRNVGKAEVEVAVRPLWLHPAGVVDAAGQRVRGVMPPMPLYGIVLNRLTIQPGQTVDVSRTDVAVAGRDLPDRPDPPVKTYTIRGMPGKHTVRFGGFVQDRPGVVTGGAELEIQDPPAPAAAVSDYEALQGEWAVVAMEGGGKQAPADELKGMKWTVEGDEIRARQPGAAARMSFKLTPGTTPKGIDLTVSPFGAKGQTAPGIYTIDGPRLRVCVGEKVRPTAFATAPGDDRTILTLEREAVVAWGREVGGLQLGLVLPPASRVVTPGTLLVLEVRVRNVGKADATIVHSLLREFAPAVTGGGGKHVRVAMPPYFGGYVPPTERVVAAGETVSLYRPELAVEAGDPDAGQKVGTPTVRVAAGKYVVAYSGVLTSHPGLATGAVGIEVRDPPAEPLTAWGKEAGGLQAGLGIVGGKKAYRLGETVTLIVRVRNVGKEAVTFEYIPQYLDEHPPGVTGADGKAIPQATSGVTGIVHLPVAVRLEPGKDVVLGTRIRGTGGVPYDLWPAVGAGLPSDQNHPLRVGTGKVALRYDRVIGDSSIGRVRVDPRVAGLATGRLELEVSGADRVESLHVPTHDGLRELKGKDAADYRAANAWLEERYREAGSIKVGSTYADVVRYFRSDGGLMVVGGGRYVNILCPLMKIDVEFEPGRGGVVPATARVTRVSRPYFEREFLD